MCNINLISLVDNASIFIFASMDIEKYLAEKQEAILNTKNFKSIYLNNEWVNTIPQTPGTYVFELEGQIVYVGETGNLRGRMRDLLDTRHHNIRRNLGHKLYAHTPDYLKASSKLKFPDIIERQLIDYIKQNMKVSFLSLSLGRKELEERIFKLITEENRLNIRAIRAEI